MGGLKHQLENFRVVGGDAFAVKPRDTILYREEFSGVVKNRASGIRVIRSDGVNGEGSEPRVSGIRPIFVAALAAAMLPACTSSGQQFPVATDLLSHPMSIYWRDRLFSKMHFPSSHAGSPKRDPTADILNTASVQRRPRLFSGNANRPST